MPAIFDSYDFDAAHNRGQYFVWNDFLQELFR